MSGDGVAEPIADGPNLPGAVPEPQDESPQDGAKQNEGARFVLSEKELLFRKCLRSRFERAAQRKKELKEKKEADERKRKQALEDAFENEVDKLLSFFADGYAIDTVDAYGSSLLSEACAGGAEECIEVLLGHGAAPNNIGRHKRTPLWRAAWAGHASCVQLILRAGGDPRIPDDSGVLPWNVANGAKVRMLLECWDISVTENLRQSFVANLKKMEKQQQEKEKAQLQEMKDALEEVERKAIVAKSEVTRLQSLVFDYRQQQCGHAARGEVAKLNETKPLLEHAEAQLESAQQIKKDMEWQSKRARMKLRDFENKLMRKQAKKTGQRITKPDQVIWLRDIVDVVTKDVGGKRREDGRWPLIFDPSGKSATFFRYCGAAFFEVAELACFAASEEPEEQRRLLTALLRHLKYGGQVVVNLGDELEKLSVVETAFNDISPGLFKIWTDRSVLYSYLLPRRFLDIVPEDMARDYDPLMFEDEYVTAFVLAFVVTAEEPNMDVMERQCSAFHIVKVRDPEAPTEAELDAEAEAGGAALPPATAATADVS